MANNRLNTGQNMRKVEVNKQELLTKLRQNRVKHIDNYKKAVEEYRLASLADIQKKQENVTKVLKELEKKIKDSTSPISLNVNEDLLFDLNPPVSHEKEYEEITQLFEMEVNETVELDSIEFSQYVLDNWNWKGELENQRVFYASKAVGFAP